LKKHLAIGRGRERNQKERKKDTIEGKNGIADGDEVIYGWCNKDLFYLD
jgi:hypothetical protein